MRFFLTWCGDVEILSRELLIFPSAVKRTLAFLSFPSLFESSSLSSSPWRCLFFLRLRLSLALLELSLEVSEEESVFSPLSPSHLDASAAACHCNHATDYTYAVCKGFQHCLHSCIWNALRENILLVMHAFPGNKTHDFVTNGAVSYHLHGIHTPF